MTKRRFPTRAFGFIAVAVLLAGCENPPQGLAFLQPKDRAAEGTATPSTSTRLVERDVEAPEVFQVTEAGLWDGRPSLGGVWVAHPDVVDPERVIIRNSANGKFVIGALFRRERDIPGPRLQTSSD
ncbi:MAG: SPOR domain-containing protein, partial [Proteobacteria bacterium]|nr:SPOR domain-containing protein [Pseudomonadota bacterium]